MSRRLKNALSTLVAREKPGFQALSKGLIVLLCAEVVRQGVPGHGTSIYYLLLLLLLLLFIDVVRIFLCGCTNKPAVFDVRRIEGAKSGKVVKLPAPKKLEFFFIWKCHILAHF